MDYKYLSLSVNNKLNLFSFHESMPSPKRHESSFETLSLSKHFTSFNTALRNCKILCKHFLNTKVSISIISFFMNEFASLWPCSDVAEFEVSYLNCLYKLMCRCASKCLNRKYKVCIVLMFHTFLRHNFYKFIKVYCVGMIRVDLEGICFTKSSLRFGL